MAAGGSPSTDPKVALPIHQRVAQRKRLRHAHQRVVDGRVAVRMVDAHRLAHHLGALRVFLVVLEAHLAQRVEHAAMHGLQTHREHRASARPMITDIE